MSKELIAGINQVATDKDLDNEVIFDAIEAALISAYKRNYGSVANVTAAVDRATGEMKVFAEKEVVEDILNPNTEILLDDARTVEPSSELGDVVLVQNTPGNFGRIAAQTAKQVILQRIREAERDTVYENFVHKVGETITAQVRSVDLVSGAVTILIDDRHENLLPREEQIPSENLRRGDYICLYVVDVHRSSRGPMIKLSRTHRDLLRRLMEQEIPEVRDGTVEIKAISREPGARSKVAVMATLPGVDPVGSCVGMRGLRIQNIVTELAGEKIDVVEWSGNLRTYISNALGPAKVQSVILEEDSNIKTAIVIVPDRQLSLAIGKAGQNARLAAKLTGWRIDIKSETEAHAEGLDLLAAEQAQLAAGEQDLLSMAEKILRDKEESTASEDTFRQAAELLQRRDAASRSADQGTPAEWPETFPAQEEGRGLGVDAEEALSAFERAAAAVQEEKPSGISFEDFAVDEPEPVSLGETLDDEEDVREESDEGPEAEEVSELPALHPSQLPAQTEEPEPEPERTLRPEDLPQVITADMLRQRMAARQQGSSSGPVIGSLDDLEVPPELLDSLDTAEDADDELEEQDPGRSRARRGGQATQKRQPRRQRTRRSRGLEVDLEEFDDDGFDL
ncbi:MAG: transcription termination factor NusA [Caldilineaceae bacterium]|nr:transcription termination factor NusA [Caldilineaceae bacterium]